jgi:hypothetical protein
MLKQVWVYTREERYPRQVIGWRLLMAELREVSYNEARLLAPVPCSCRRCGKVSEHKLSSAIAPPLPFIYCFLGIVREEGKELNLG